jgi:hypothetical protein
MLKHIQKKYDGGGKMRSMCVFIVCCLFLTACGSSAKTANSSIGQDHTKKPTLDVKLVITGNKLAVKVETDLKLSPDGGRVPGQGHSHMYLDDGEKLVVKTWDQVFTDLTPGMHNLRVSLHNNDHTPYDVTKSIDFEIK